jgi:hypothetical protein
MFDEQTHSRELAKASPEDMLLKKFDVGSLRECVEGLPVEGAGRNVVPGDRGRSQDSAWHSHVAAVSRALAAGGLCGCQSERGLV